MLQRLVHATVYSNRSQHDSGRHACHASTMINDHLLTVAAISHRHRRFAIPDLRVSAAFSLAAGMHVSRTLSTGFGTCHTANHRSPCYSPIILGHSSTVSHVTGTILEHITCYTHTPMSHSCITCVSHVIAHRMEHFITILQLNSPSNPSYWTLTILLV